MSASDPAYEIEKLALFSPEFDIQNVSSALNFKSHDELSLIETMETDDNIPVLSRMVDHDTFGRKKSPSCNPDPTDLNLSVWMAELQQDLAAGPELLTQIKTDGWTRSR